RCLEQGTVVIPTAGSLALQRQMKATSRHRHAHTHTHTHPHTKTHTRTHTHTHSLQMSDYSLPYFANIIPPIRHAGHPSPAEYYLKTVFLSPSNCRFFTTAAILI